MKIYRLFVGLILLALSLFITGCETTGSTDDDLDQKPWTQREPWEGGMGVPF